MNKRIKNILKKHIKLIIGIVIGLIIPMGVYGATILFDSEDVSYDNTTSGLTSNNVQDALDELKIKTASCAPSDNPYGSCYTPSGVTYYAFGDPTASSTTDYTTLNKKLFIALNGTQKSVCFIKNDILYCLPNNNYNCTKNYMSTLFNYGVASNSCSENDGLYTCTYTGPRDLFNNAVLLLNLTCNVSASGVDCTYGNDYSCNLNSQGVASCNDLTS